MPASSGSSGSTRARSTPALAARIDVVAADLRSAELPPLVRAAAVDTVVHNDIVQFPEPGRPRASLHDVNVIGTLQLLTVCEGLPTLRAIVVRGSAAIYGSEAGAPAFFTEEDADRFPLRTRFQRDIGELERLVGAFARRHPAVTCTVLRLQPVVGRGLDTPVNRLLRAPVVPTMLGFDPRVQLLDADDAVAALRRGRAAPGARPGQRRRRRRGLALARAAPHPPPGGADRRAAVGDAGRHGAPRGAAARAARRDRALPALRARRRHRAHAPRAGLPARALDARGARARSGGRMSEDDWGFDPDFARTLAPLLDALYTRWWRVEAEGADQVPAEGPALVVANQTGGQPWDAAMVATALRRGDVRRDDPPRFLVPGSVFELPWASTALRRLGGVPAGAGNAARLLAEGRVVMAFPEGGRGTGASYARALSPRAPRTSAASSSSRCAAARRSCPCALVGGGSGIVDRVLARVGAPAAPARAAAGAAARPRAGASTSASRCTSPTRAPTPPRTPRSCSSWSTTIRARLQEKVYDSLVNRKGAL